MALSRRYHPEFAPGETSVIGMDFSTVIPPGVGITAVSPSLMLNIATPPVPPADTADFLIQNVSWYDRTAYATLTLNNSALGKDFLLFWQVTDSSSNVHQRAAALLCTYTS